VKRLLLTSPVMIALLAGSASAADVRVAPAYRGPPAVPAYNWNGFYLGGNLGGHFGQDRISTTTDPNGAFFPAGAAAIDATSPTTLKPQGVMGGVQGGYNWQFGGLVVGAEADANWLAGAASRTLGPGAIPVINPNDYMVDSTRAKFLLTARPRVGWAWDRVLLYVTGGYAYGTVHTVDTVGAFGGLTVNVSDVTSKRSGWTAGAGVEWAFWNGWSTKLEYLYVDLGSFNTPTPGTNTLGFPLDLTVNVHHKYTDNIVRAGLNYHFGW
jgi:outer membrane immunogenic protein